jgi:hypothetical protein
MALIAPTDPVTIAPDVAAQVHADPNKVYWFQLHADVGQHFDFQVLPLTPPPAGTTHFSFNKTLIDAGGHVISGVLDSGDPFEPSVSGDYYLGVSALQAVDFSLVQATLNDDYSINDTSPAHLQAGGQLDAALQYSGDRDRVKFDAQAGHIYNFELRGEDSGALNVMQLGVHDSAGNTMPISYLQGNDGTVHVSVVAARAGAISLDVADGYFVGSHPSPLHYTLRAVGDVVDDYSNSLITAAQLVPGHAVSGSIQSAADIDMVQVVLQAGTTYALSLRQTSTGPAGSTSLTVGGHDGHVIATPAFGAERDYLFTPDSSGTYFLSAASGELMDYVLSVSVAGGSGNDSLHGGANGVTLNGGAGIDTVSYSGNRADYTVTRSGAEATVAPAAGGTSDLLAGVERLHFADGSLALDIDGNGGQVYRLYQAAFHRAPDQVGLGFWMDAMDRGMDLQTVAHGFMASAEYQSLYGAPGSDADYVAQLYQNVLHRAGDAGGTAFWLNALHSGHTREQVMAFFSESPENQATLVGVIGNGFAYVPHG